MTADERSPAHGWLSKVGQVLRELPDPSWDEIVDTVIDAVRATPRGGWPLRAHDHDDPAPTGVSNIITVSDLIVRGAVARAVHFDQVATAAVVEVFTDGDELRRVRIELTARYGTELREVVDTARAAAAAAIDDLLGISTPRDGIDVEITDVVDGNPAQQDPDPTGQ